MIERKDLFTIPFYKKTHFTGSYLNMRYRIERAEGKPSPDQSDEKPISILKAYVFPGPYCYEATDDTLKKSCDFEFSEKGIEDACQWLNEQYESNKEKWT